VAHPQRPAHLANSHEGVRVHSRHHCATVASACAGGSSLSSRLSRGLARRSDGDIRAIFVCFQKATDVSIFCNALKYFKLGVSWGGHESLVVPAEVVLQQKALPNSAQTFGINPRSVRLHVGLEGTETLWGDLDNAIAAAAG
jgi:cystathionine beta-lyase/cystathionine gamma-synthase